MKHSLAILCLIIAAPGCGTVDDGLPKTVNASGIIKVDDQSLEGASIVIMQTDGDNRFAHAVSDKSGRFSLTAFETKKGAVPGKYLATVSKTVEVSGKGIPKSVKVDAQAAGGESTSNVSWKNELPDRYNSPVTSGLTITIPDSGASDLSLSLHSK